MFAAVCKQIYANIPTSAVGDMETWAVQRANGAATQQIRLRIVKGPFSGRFLTAGEPQSNGALYLGDAAPDQINNPPRDVFNFTVGLQPFSECPQCQCVFNFTVCH